MLDSIYAVHNGVHREVEESLEAAEFRLNELQKRAADARNPAASFDCDDIALYLRGWVNGHALHEKFGSSYCFGVTVMETPANRSDPLSFGAASSHALNWLIVRKNPNQEDSEYLLKFVELVPHDRNRQRIRERRTEADQVPDLILTDADNFIRSAGGNETDNSGAGAGNGGSAGSSVIVGGSGSAEGNAATRASNVAKCPWESASLILI